MNIKTNTLRLVALLALTLAPIGPSRVMAQAVAAPQADTPDPRLGAAHREERAGWIVAHLQGKPADVGFQHGWLLSAEIDDSIKTLQADLQHDGQSWDTYRKAAQTLFWSKLDKEYQEEIAGIAEGVKARGLAYDATDILAYNSHIEIQGYYLPSLRMRRTKKPVSKAPMSCSAFVATGSQTADGKIVMGHNLWWGYLMGQRWRVLLDIKPEKGQHILMDALPGFIHSGSDFAINGAGILITETTIGGFMGFDPDGLPEFMRMRKATQYATSLDDFARIMTSGNNGGYANTWLLGDTKTNEIGKLELGLKNVIFSRTTDGAYVGANYPEDPKLAKEECFPGAANNASCVGRRARWATVLKENQGRVDAEKAKSFLADTYNEITKTQGAGIATLCGRADLDASAGNGLSGAVNSKVVTSDSARQMQIWARMGFSDGSELLIAPYLKAHPNQEWLAPYFHDIKAQPWIQVQARP